MDTIIEGRDLVKVYGTAGRRSRRGRSRQESTGKPAVNGVSFDIARGELFVIMGLSGSGKSTLLRMLNRLVEPSSGTLRLAGHDLLGLDAERLREVRNKTVNMVFQHFAIFPHRTVLENAAYGLQVRGTTAAERIERAQQALATVGLAEWANRYPSELSGGMRQRVGLARALATDADILLMDEPFSALDPLIRRDMQELLIHLQGEVRKTIVFVTHDLNEAMRLGDRIMVLRGGSVIQVGTPAEILSTPADDYVADFVSDVDRARVVTAQSVALPLLLGARLDEAPAEVLRRIEPTGAEGIYVLDGQGRVDGVLLTGRLREAVRESRTSLHGLLVDEYDTVPAETLLIDIYRRVGGHPVPLGVVDAQRRLLGVIPRDALLRALADRTEATNA